MTTGEIVLIQFPFTDLTERKVRPALVISSDIQIRQSADAVFLLITSNTTNVKATDLLLDTAHPEFPATGLKKPSVFRVDKVHSLQQNLAARRLGSIGSVIKQEINNRLRLVLGL